MRCEVAMVQMAMEDQQMAQGMAVTEDQVLHLPRPLHPLLMVVMVVVMVAVMGITPLHRLHPHLRRRFAIDFKVR